MRVGTFGLLGAGVVQNNNVGISGEGGVIKGCCEGGELDGVRKVSCRRAQ